MVDDANVLKASNVMSGDDDMWERINTCFGSKLFELRRKIIYNQETTWHAIIKQAIFN